MLRELITEFIDRQEKLGEKHHLAHYPTEASCVHEDKVYGMCLRSAYYSEMMTKSSNKIDERGSRTFELGRLVEEAEVGRYRNMGILVGDQVPVYDAEHNISGYTDAVVELLYQNKLSYIGVEIKSGYSHWWAKEISIKPKNEHIIQSAIYSRKLGYPWLIVYIDRGSAAIVSEFFLKEKEDSDTWFVDGKRVPWFSLESVYERFQILDMCKITGKVPDRDFSIHIKGEALEKLMEGKGLSKTKLADIIKGTKAPANWQCAYCRYMDKCWKGTDEIKSFTRGKAILV